MAKRALVELDHRHVVVPQELIHVIRGAAMVARGSVEGGEEQDFNRHSLDTLLLATCYILGDSVVIETVENETLEYDVKHSWAGEYPILRGWDYMSEHGDE